MTPPDSGFKNDIIFHGKPVAALHVGDLGWNHQFGAAALAEGLRVWHVDDRLAAVGLLDEPTLMRLTGASPASSRTGSAFAE